MLLPSSFLDNLSIIQNKLLIEKCKVIVIWYLVQYQNVGKLKH